MADTLISLEDVGLTLASPAGDVEILRGIDLDVAQGESVGIVGPSGSGKSSLLMVLGGLERATAGKVNVLGQELTGLDEDALARLRRQRLGVVFQAFHLIPTMTAIENVATPLELAGRADAFDRASTLLNQVGLSHREGHYPAQMSGGEQQRVALARALAPGPELLLADEPTGNLDGKTGEAVVDLLFGLSTEQAVTLVLVTHAPALAARCGRTVSMADGRIVGQERRVAVSASGEAA
ncbi:MAG: ATP-binding cassette domain-containing protein [Pseudomonadota bacterium]